METREDASMQDLYNFYLKKYVKEYKLPFDHLHPASPEWAAHVAPDGKEKKFHRWFMDEYPEIATQVYEYLKK